MASVSEICTRGKGPVSAGINLGRANWLTIIVQGDGTACFADAAEGGAGIIGTLTVSQRSGFSANVVIYNYDIGRIGCGGIRCCNMPGLAWYCLMSRLLWR